MPPPLPMPPPMPASPFDTARLAQMRVLRHPRRRARSSPRKATLDLSHGSPSQRSGHAAEQQASAYLQQHGVQIIARNLRCRHGEMDLVAQDGRTLVFIEVRARRGSRHGGAAASVNRHKQQRMIRTARSLLPHLVRQYFGGDTPPCRFDVITVEAGTLQWLRHAFEI